MSMLFSSAPPIVSTSPPSRFLSLARANADPRRCITRPACRASPVIALARDRRTLALRLRSPAASIGSWRHPRSPAARTSRHEPRTTHAPIRRSAAFAKASRRRRGRCGSAVYRGGRSIARPPSSIDAASRRRYAGHAVRPTSLQPVSYRSLASARQDARTVRRNSSPRLRLLSRPRFRHANPDRPSASNELRSRKPAVGQCPSACHPPQAQIDHPPGLSSHASAELASLISIIRDLTSPQTPQ